LRRQVSAARIGRLHLFDGQSSIIGIGILTDAGDLPGDLDIGLVGLNGELVSGDLGGDDRLGKLPDDGELV
jgi:hypothetical protein